MAIPRLGEALGWKGNPLYDGLAARRNALMGFGAGLAGGADLGQGIALGLQGAQEGAARDDAYALLQQEQQQKQDALNKTTEYLTAQGYSDLLPLVEGGYGSDALREAFARQKPGYGQPDQTAQMQNYQFLVSQGVDPQQALGQVFGGSGGTPTVSTQPQYFTDPQTGETRLGQLSSSGQVVWSDTNGLVPLTPGDLAQSRSYGTAAGKGQFENEMALGGAELTAQTANNAIERLRNNKQGQEEQFGKFLGVIPQQWLPVTPGTAKGNFQVDLEQAQGQAFLQAREFLKGQGQITDFESRRAEAAFSRLEAAARVGDQNAFNEALNDFQDAVNAGLAKVQAQAGRRGAAPASLTGTTSSGLSWSIEP